jgi:hypothetical protein
MPTTRSNLRSGATSLRTQLNFLTKRIEDRRTKLSTGALIESLLLMLKPLRHKGINDLGATVLDRSEDQPHDDTWPHAPYRKGAHPRTRTTLDVSCSVLNHTPHNPETTMANTRLSKGELASPSRYTSLFTTLLTHSFSVPLLT